MLLFGRAVLGVTLLTFKYLTNICLPSKIIMKLKLKRIDQQTVVITGASSGIGLVTARMFAKKGAKLVLVARSEDSLRKLADEITSAGGQAMYVVADVGKEAEVNRVADEAIKRFGGFDTWINDAGVSIYGNLLEVPLQDMRQLFETNFWGVTYGSLAAARHLKQRGGAIINVGCTLSDRAIPMQGMYSASKHAVKGFTDSLRMELEAEKAPVSVTLIKPGAIDTPYPHHAKNYMNMEPKNPAPVYAPEIVANAILHCAVHPERDVFAGAGGKMISAMGYHLPRVTDKWMEKSIIDQQKSDQPIHDRNRNGLYQASGELDERGGHPGHVVETCVYTRASMHRPLTTALLLSGAGLALAMLSRGKSRNLGERVPQMVN
jgi:short-subunit dehydrogenase